MRHLRLIMTACVAMATLAGCAEYVSHQHMHENYYRRSNVSDKALQVTSTWCDGLRCHRVMHFDSDCQPVDDHGNSLTHLDAKIGTHICFFNDTGCPLTLKFGSVLFGPAHSTITIDTGKCATLIVTQQAGGGMFSIEQICTCKEGHGHTNPTVKVGEDEEGGGG